MFQFDARVSHQHHLGEQPKSVRVRLQGAPSPLAVASNPKAQKTVVGSGFVPFEAEEQGPVERGVIGGVRVVVERKFPANE